MPEGERKTVTALFADIKGSTEMMRDLDPEDARAIIDPAIQLMIKALHRYDGYVVQSTGDGIFAVFGAPAAHEDHPQRALHAALATFDELRRAGELLAPGRTGVEVRIGINTGEVVMRLVQTGGHTEYSPIGHTINLAKRVEGAAPSGGIAVSDETRRLVEGYFELRSLGPAEVKGLDEAIDVYEVIGVGALHDHFDVAAQRGLTKFVGRENELSQMRRALELAIGGKGQIVSVVAEAGIGNSRLFYEFKATLPPECKLIEAYSVSHGKATAWLPVLELLRRYFNLAAADDPAIRREKIRATLAALDASLEDTLLYLFGLLGIVEGADPLAQMDPQIKRQRTLEAIKRIVSRESLNQPVVLIFEDLHWIDSQTQALLDLLADSIANARLLLLTNYRPEYRHEWTNRSYYSQLRLDPLGSVDGSAMLAELLGTSVELNPLKRLVTERTGGNPFFIEEIVKALFDEGALVRNGVVKVTRSLSQLRLPATVQGILASRIDRQPAEHKQLLQILAVIGRKSSSTLLKQVVSLPDTQLQGVLVDLQAGEFIYEEPSAAETQYVFKHALTQEVAYNSLLIERRRELHGRIGASLESFYVNSLDDHLSELAHHYERSNDVEKAVDYLGRAAQQAVSRSAFNEALLLRREGVALITGLPAATGRRQREFDLRHSLVRAATAIEGYGSPQTVQDHRRVLELARDSGNDEVLSNALLGMWMDRRIAADHKEAVELVRQMLEVGERRGNSAAMADAHYAQGWTLFDTGRSEGCLATANRSIALCPDGTGRRSVDGNDPLVGSLSCAGLSSWVAGYPERAISLIESAIKRARDLNQPFSMGFAVFCEIWSRYFRGEIPVTQQLCDELEELAEQGGFTSWLVLNRIYRGWVTSMQGEHERAIELIRSGIANWAPANLPYLSSILAEACTRGGRYQEAMDTIAAGREHAVKTGGHFAESELERAAGETLLMMSSANTREAEQHMRLAVTIAVEQGAKSFELRATTSLARLLSSQGHHDEARTMLADIYSWFTEGFDTADLIDAKALLDQLTA